MAIDYETRLFINGEYVAPTSRNTLTVTNPTDGSTVTTLLSASQNDVDKAVEHAEAAYRGEWSTWSASKRSQALNKLADLIEQHAAELDPLETIAMGQPVSVSTAMLKWAASLWRYYAGWTDKIPGEQYPAEEDGVYKISGYEPLGVCAGIGAWNGSLLFITTKGAPALAAGNTFIYKPSEKSPLGALAFARLFAEAGFPPGVLNVVTGAGDVGAMLASHPKIRKISFTGSVPTGKKIQQLAAGNLKHVTLELGGKSPAVVFEDADLEKALHVCGDAFLFNSSQACVATSRAFVHEKIAPQFLEGMKKRFGELQSAFGNPMEAGTQYGPLADRLQFDRVQGYIDVGKKEAELIAGGDTIGKTGLFIQPTIFLNPSDDARIYREEIFGPVLTIRTFQTEEEAIKLANDTVYGLSSVVLTESIGRALRVARKIEAGAVSINGTHGASVVMSMGGFKESGIGRELGRQGIMGYLQSKSIFINIGEAQGSFI